MPLPARVIRLGDGRALCIAEFGAPAGPPVFYMHGWPASRIEAALIPDLPARLIALDRPGYGGSDPKPGRTIAEFAQDVAEAADRLDIGRFAVVGVSGGGAYALACAQAWPDRITGTAIISAVPPADTLGIGEDLARLFWLGRHPGAARVLLGTGRALLRSGAVRPRVLAGEGLPPSDRAFLTPEIGAQLAEAWREGLRAGIAGALSDARLYARPWGLDFAAIQAPVTLWHGAADTIVPADTHTAFAALPNATRHILAGEGHYSLALGHGRMILDALTALV